MLFGREDIACLLHAVQVKEGDLRIARTGTGPSMEWGSIKSSENMHLWLPDPISLNIKNRRKKSKKINSHFI
jgi:hypothetical protein